MEKKKRSKLPIVLAVLAALIVVLACGWLLALKPLLTLKKDVEAVRDQDGSYTVSLTTQQANASSIFASVEAQRNGTLFAGDLSLTGYDHEYGFYIDAVDKSALLEIGPVIKTVLPEKAAKVDSVLGLTDKLNGKYISLNQLAEIAGAGDVSGLAGLAGLTGASTASGKTTDELKTAAQDILAMVQNDDYSVRPMLSTKVLQQKGIDTDGYYFFTVQQKTFDGTLYIGCGQSSGNGFIHMQVYLDYTDQSRMDEHLTVSFHPQSVSLTMPDSVLSQEDVDTLKKLVDVYKEVSSSVSTAVIG